MFFETELMTLAASAFVRARGWPRPSLWNRRQSAKLRRQAFRVLVGELEDHRVTRNLRSLNGVLGNHLILVFNFDRDGFIGQIRFGQFKDRCHFSGLNAMIIVFSHPDLELAGHEFAKGATAVEKGFLNPPHFRHVK